MGKGDRAASAASAAELLAKSGTGRGSGFGGFAGSAAVGQGGFAFGSKYIDAQPGQPSAGDAAKNAILPPDLDGELAQQLQRLSKRDSTTRVKALQALRALIPAKSQAEVLAMLPAWAYLFGRLVMDAHRGVRAEACLAMGAVAAAAGRGLAPSLKALLPPWYLAQYDGHAEVAAAAAATLREAFPGAKERGAVMFCRAEVLQLLEDNLGSSPQSLGDARREGPEELAERHERVLVATCSAALALVRMATEAAPGPGPGAGAPQADADAAPRRELLDGVRALLGGPAFARWTLQSKAARVRRSAYYLVAGVARAAPALLDAAALAAAVLGAVGDKDSGNHPAMWDMLLSFGKAHPAAWDSVDLSKAFLPRLWALLRHACYGSAPASYPAVLPLLTVLPPARVTPQLLETLLASVWEGLHAAPADAGQDAAAACLEECALYAVLRAERLAPGGPELFCDALLGAALAPGVLPAAIAPGGSGDTRLARSVLGGLVRKLSGYRRQNAAAAWKLDAVLRLAGQHFAAAAQASLGGGEDGGGAAALQAVGEVAAELAAAEGAGAAAGSVGGLVGRPLMAALLPAVRAASAPPAASSLLAALMQLFPGQLALAPEQEESGAGAGASSAGTSAAALQRSASATIDSVVERLAGAQLDEAALGASCDLLVSCLPQAAHPAAQLAAALRALLSGRGPAAAAVLAERLVSASGPVSLADCLSAELDALCGELCAGIASAAAAAPADVRLAELLLAGDDAQSLLTEAGQADALRALARRPGGPGALQIARRALASPAVGAGLEVAQLRVDMAASSFGVLLEESHAAAALEVGPGAGSEGDESEEEREHSELYGLALAIWNQPRAIAGLLQRTPAAAQAAFAGGLAAALRAHLDAAGPGAAALSAAVSCAQSAFAACGEPPLQQQLLRELEAGRGAHAGAVLGLGEALGFGALLAAFGDDAAGAAARLLAAGAPAASSEQLVRHVVASSAARGGEGGLLPTVLAAALDLDLAAGSADGVGVLTRLLRAAAASQGLSCAAAAGFFRARLAGSEDAAVLAAAVPAVAPAFRESAERLQQSGLPALALRLCEAASAPDCSTATLAAAAACFPCRHVAPPDWAPPAAAAFAKGDAVWYQHKIDSRWEATEIAAVDVSVQPPSYAVQLRSGHRETEGGRLRERREGEAAPPAGPAPGRHAMADHGFECGAEERQALLALLRRRAAPESEAPGAGAGGGGGGGAAAADAQVVRGAVGYCWRLFSEDDWRLALDHLQVAVQRGAEAVGAAADAVAGAVTASAAVVAGVQFSSPALALQFFRRLVQRNVLQSSAKAAAEARNIGEVATAALAELRVQQQSTLLPALQCYSQVAAAAPAAPALPLPRWEEAQAGVCAAALQAFVSTGALLAAATGAAQREAALALQLPSWQPAWAALGAVVTYALRTADADFLRAAVQRADAAGERTGSDCVDALLALALDDAAPDAMHAAAYAALLLHPELTAALTGAAAAADSEDGDAFDRAEAAGAGAGAGGGDAAAAVLEVVGVRAELAAAVADPGHPSFLGAWALLAAHLLALPPASGGRRLLVQCLKEVHSLVPAALNAALPHLPLGAAPGARAGGTPPPRRAPAPATIDARDAAAAAADVDGRGFAQRMLAAAAPRGAPSQEFAAGLYAGLLRALPVSSRLWFAELRDKGAAAALERYTAAAVSPGLLAAEYAAVAALQGGGGGGGAFLVRAVPSSREVVASLEVEDGHRLELAVRLPAALPLRPPEAECRRSVGVADARLRKWLLSITAFLRNQNGAAAGAIRMWQRNVDSEFEGQEECLICVSIIQPSTGQLPRLGCRTCRKRFHGTCLYTWFKSSGKSNCPHCQSPW